MKPYVKAKRKGALLFFLLVLCIMMMHTTLPAYSNTIAFCYRGNPCNNELIDNIEVPDPEQAAALCNQVYFDCQGTCGACYTEFGGRHICLDHFGEMVNCW